MTAFFAATASIMPIRCGGGGGQSVGVVDRRAYHGSRGGFSTRDGEALKGEYPFGVFVTEEGAMSKRVVTPRIAPLQRIVATEITDPAERAALLEASRQAHRNRSRRKPKVGRKGVRGGSSAK
jgi:hypothetical protein